MVRNPPKSAVGGWLASLRHLGGTAFSMPPGAAAGKAVRFVRRIVRDGLIGLTQRNRCSYAVLPTDDSRLQGRLMPIDGALLRPYSALLRADAEEILAHRFDLLGSGSVRVAHGEVYGGFGQICYGPGPAVTELGWRRQIAKGHWRGNRAPAAALLALIKDERYAPIDWHVDFRSGYRWPVRHWGGSILYGHKPGVDIKLPWELARLQHLPRLALAYGVENDARYVREFSFQALDFLASNPPGWGVNWACAMDVAIRASNLALAWDLFRAAGASFPGGLEAALASALLAHGRHVIATLEWNPHHRGNHYLANICGLLFTAAYLPRTTETDRWLVFATQQLEAEILRQFGPDGGNFEGSTAYHRLSTEMALFAVALVLGLPPDRQAAFAECDPAAWKHHPPIMDVTTAWPPFSPSVLARLARAIGFAADVTKPSGDMVQIGDNDSGRFFKLTPLKDADGAENVLDGSHIWRRDCLESVLLDRLSGRNGFLSQEAFRGNPPSQGVKTPPLGAEAGGAATKAIRIVVTPADAAALAGLKAIAYPDFGLFIWRNARSFVSVRCGPIGGNGLGAHAHNDQLAVEIECDGRAFARDPGTYVYTSDLAARNAYRSALAHFVPRCGKTEPARLDLGPFRLEDRARAAVMHFSECEFLGSHHGFGEPIWRRVTIGSDSVTIEDCQGGAVIGPDTEIVEHSVRNPQDLTELWGEPPAFSPGYGRQE